MSEEEWLKLSIEKIAVEQYDSRRRISALKSKLAEEETRIIELQLTKDSLQERLRRHMNSLISQEKEQAEKEIDEEFLRKLPSLMEKV